MDQRVSKALEGIQRYLSSPPILTKVLSEEDLYLYLLASPLAIGATLVRKDSKGQKLDPNLEKLAYALVIAKRKLRHYLYLWV